MQPQFFLKSSIVLCLIVASASYGAEVRKYSFVGDAPVYQFSCGECSGLPYWIRGRVEGAFEVTLDFEHGIGTLNTLDSQLNNVEGNFGVNIWQPIEWGREFLVPGSRYDQYRPPYIGVLTPAAFRPLGPGTLTGMRYGTISRRTDIADSDRSRPLAFRGCGIRTSTSRIVDTLFPWCRRESGWPVSITWCQLSDLLRGESRGLQLLHSDYRCRTVYCCSERVHSSPSRRE